MGAEYPSPVVPLQSVLVKPVTAPSHRRTKEKGAKSFPGRAYTSDAAAAIPHIVAVPAAAGSAPSRRRADEPAGSSPLQRDDQPGIHRSEPRGSGDRPRVAVLPPLASGDQPGRFVLFLPVRSTPQGLEC